MKLKRIAALLLSITVAVTALAGCGNSGSAGNDSAQNTQTEDTGSAAPETDAGDADAETDDTGAGETAAAGGTVEFWNDKMANMEQSSLDTVFGTIQSVSGYTLDMIPFLSDGYAADHSGPEGAGAFHLVERLTAADTGRERAGRGSDICMGKFNL